MNNEWQILLEWYRLAIHDYHQVADALDTTATAWQRVEMARRRVEISRAAILHHEHEHGCLHSEFPVAAEATPGAER